MTYTENKVIPLFLWHCMFSKSYEHHLTVPFNIFKVSNKCIQSNNATSLNDIRQTRTRKRPSTELLALTPKRMRFTVPTKTPKKRIIQLQVSLPCFHVNELIWAYVRGYPSWPGVIESITARGKFLIHFFGDYSRAEVTKSCITNFYEGFKQYINNCVVLMIKYFPTMNRRIR